MVRLIIDVDLPEIDVGDINMIILDMDMPEKCKWCPLREDKSYCIITGKYITIKDHKLFPDWCPIVSKLDFDRKDFESKISEKLAFSIRAVEAMKDSKLTENMKYPFHTFDSEFKPPSEYNKDKK